jgi:hypothetical protein
MAALFRGLTTIIGGSAYQRINKIIQKVKGLRA